MNGDNKPIKSRVRDIEESVRNLNKDIESVIKSQQAMHERIGKGHEYQLMETRLQTEELKELFSQKIEPRIVSLEHWRTYVHGIVVALTGIITYVKTGHK